MNGLERLRALSGSALAALEANRGRLDDLNVYPVPDGDTGTNLTLTVRSVVEALRSSTAPDRQALAREVTRAALMGARGNSGVILSQIVRGAADALGEASSVDGEAVARAFRAASDAAYRGVRRPVEGTMLTVIRELAEEAEARAASELALPDLLAALVRRGDDAVARTPQQLAVLREAGVVDAGAAGLVELVRGLAIGLGADAAPPEPLPREALGVDAAHQELSRFRYCTSFVVEGGELDADELERAFERLGDSLLVVGDSSALKVHVHTDDPGAALAIATRAGTIEGVEIANMHRQTEARQERLLRVVPDEAACAVVAVAAGGGNRALFESLGAGSVLEGGQTMNPSVAELVALIEAVPAAEAIVLPNNRNVVGAAESAVRATTKPAHVLATASMPEGLAAMVAFDPGRTARENLADMRAAAAAVATGEVTVASRDARLDGLAIRRGDYLGLAEGVAIAAGDQLCEVAQAVVERLLREPRGVVTLLTGADEPQLEPLVERLRDRYPELELDVHSGGQPHYPLLISAE